MAALLKKLAALLKKLVGIFSAPAYNPSPLFPQLPPELQLEIWDQYFSDAHVHMLRFLDTTGIRHTAFDAQTGEPVDLEEKFMPAWASVVPNHIFLKHFERADLRYTMGGSMTKHKKNFIVSWNRDLLCIADYQSPLLFRDICISPWIARVQRLALLISRRQSYVYWNPDELRIWLQGIRNHTQNALRRPEERQLKELLLVVRPWVDPNVNAESNWFANFERDEFGFIDFTKASSFLEAWDRRMIARHCQKIQSILVEELLGKRSTQLPKIRWVLDVDKYREI
ncbi:hypothetical protein F5X99DRAFT_382632 [Biscogniauxia marginata]|nr:hypothetical protein F5X99DRAFT_382632 [Biscogniauxia marginata]